jgi:hypothetical protein
MYKAILNPFTSKLQLVLDNTIFKVKESVDTYNSLPITNNAENDIRFTKDTDLMYTWSKSDSDGELSDWLQIGSVSSVDWSVLTNKPSSSVSDIDDAVSNKHSQNTDKYLTTDVTNVLYVDNKRTDVYTENGSITKPFKTIQSANDAITGNSVTNRFVIKIATGNYYSDILTLNKDFTTLEGYGETVLSGAITITSPHVRFTNLKIISSVTLSLTNHFLLEVVDCAVNTGVWNITATAPLGDEWFQISGDATIWKSNINATGITGVASIAGGYFEGVQTYTNCWVELMGFETWGTINLEADTEATIGAVLPIDAIVNLKSGAILNADSSFISGITLNNTGGTLNLTTKASGVNNDSSVTGDTVKDALETLYELAEAPIFSNMIYVDVNGNDTTGTGTITKPFASIYKAMLSITDATPTQRYAIKVGVGFFTETENIVHKPNVWIIGENTYSTRVTFSGTYSLDASFSGTADNRFGFYSIFIDGVMNWNFLTVTATNARMYNRSCQFNKAISFTAYQSTTRCYMFDCETYSTFNITGGSSWYHNCSFNGLITVYSDANSANQFFISSTLTNGLTVNCSGTQYSDVWLVNSQIRSTLVTIGYAGLHYSFGCLPPKAWRTISAQTTASSLGNETITDMLFSRTVAGFPTYYATNKDYIVAVTNTSAPSTIYLPALSMMNDGACIIIKDETGLASANNITINRSSTNTIEGATSIVINNNYGVVVLYKASASMWVKLSTSTASSIQNTPAGNILAKDVQGAINELDTEKISKNSISGSFTTVDGKTITVVDGQITVIS